MSLSSPLSARGVCTQRCVHFIRPLFITVPVSSLLGLRVTWLPQRGEQVLHKRVIRVTPPLSSGGTVRLGLQGPELGLMWAGARMLLVPTHQTLEARHALLPAWNKKKENAYQECVLTLVLIDM